MLYGEARAESGDHILTPSKESRARLMKGATGCMPSESGYVGNQSSFWPAIQYLIQQNRRERVSSSCLCIFHCSSIEQGERGTGDGVGPR